MQNLGPGSETPRLGLPSPHSDQRTEGMDPNNVSSMKGDEASAKNGEGPSEVEVRTVIEDVQEDRMDIDPPFDVKTPNPAGVTRPTLESPDSSYGENAGTEDAESTYSSANATVDSDEERDEILWNHRPQTPPDIIRQYPQNQFYTTSEYPRLVRSAERHAPNQGCLRKTSPDNTPTQAQSREPEDVDTLSQRVRFDSRVQVRPIIQRGRGRPAWYRRIQPADGIGPCYSLNRYGQWDGFGRYVLPDCNRCEEDSPERQSQPQYECQREEQDEQRGEWQKVYEGMWEDQWLGDEQVKQEMGEEEADQKEVSGNMEEKVVEVESQSQAEQTPRACEGEEAAKVEVKGSFNKEFFNLEVAELDVWQDAIRGEEMDDADQGEEIQENAVGEEMKVAGQGKRMKENAEGEEVKENAEDEERRKRQRRSSDIC